MDVKWRQDHSTVSVKLESMAPLGIGNNASLKLRIIIADTVRGAIVKLIESDETVPEWRGFGCCNGCHKGGDNEGRKDEHLHGRHGWRGGAGVLVVMSLIAGASGQWVRPRRRVVGRQRAGRGTQRMWS